MPGTLLVLFCALLLSLVLLRGRGRQSFVALRRRGQCHPTAQDEPLAQVVHVQALSLDACHRVISTAQGQPWQTQRHDSYPTTDIATSTVPALEKMLAGANELLMENACRAFGFEPGELWLRDQFVVKYSPDAQCQLDVHSDASTISYVLALNDDYDGGGTAFASGPVLVPGKLAPGEAILFCGKRRHQGRPTTRGVRYIMTGFLDAHASPTTAARIELSNRAFISQLAGSGTWDLSISRPTRPYLRSNTYRMLGTAAALRGDMSALVRPEELTARWPWAILDSTLKAAQKVARRGTALGEERMHILFHYFLTHPSECSAFYCHIDS